MIFKFLIDRKEKEIKRIERKIEVINKMLETNTFDESDPEQKAILLRVRKHEREFSIELFKRKFSVILTMQRVLPTPK